MKTRFLLPVALAISLAAARADLQFDPKAPVPKPSPSESTASSASATTTSDAAVPTEAALDTRTAALEQRFAQGKAVETQGNLTQALAIFNAIIADAPDAKGSLREAGLISVQLGDYFKADGYFSKLHALVPDYPMAIEALVQVNQAMKHDAKVEIMIKELKALAGAGKVQEPYFKRESIQLPNNLQIVIYQFFDYHQPRYYAWGADEIDAQHQLKRRLTVNYDPVVSAQMRKDPKLANAEQFLVVDNVMDAQGHVIRLDVYQQFLSLPEYAKLRLILLEVFSNSLKPIDSAAVPQSSTGH